MKAYAILEKDRKTPILSSINDNEYDCQIVYARKFFSKHFDGTRGDLENKWDELERAGMRCVEISIEVVE